MRGHVTVTSTMQEDAYKRDLARSSLILAVVHQAFVGLGVTSLVIHAHGDD